MPATLPAVVEEVAQHLYDLGAAEIVGLVDTPLKITGYTESIHLAAGTFLIVRFDGAPVTADVVRHRLQHLPCRDRVT